MKAKILMEKIRVLSVENRHELPFTRPLGLTSRRQEAAVVTPHFQMRQRCVWGADPMDDFQPHT